ncbi:hypothetical protein BLNAU_12285 [Blattamonas nauphoetae]|uniref:Uncharacterized protein n=1 Tax=Blattamonas nauphoetae TaxID=2049346 RepID=A0ABQ9XN48_9EUKA|nr:hypothetical protein BLNAU_12285 [Blattamonas nauphoetae]
MLQRLLRLLSMGNTQLDRLLDQHPTIEEVFDFDDFPISLQVGVHRLVEFLSSPEILQDIISYAAGVPKEGINNTDFERYKSHALQVLTQEIPQVDIELSSEDKLRFIFDLLLDPNTPTDGKNNLSQVIQVVMRTNFTKVDAILEEKHLLPIFMDNLHQYSYCGIFKTYLVEYGNIDGKSHLVKFARESGLVPYLLSVIRSNERPEHEMNALSILRDIIESFTSNEREILFEDFLSPDDWKQFHEMLLNPLDVRLYRSAITLLHSMVWTTRPNEENDNDDPIALNMNVSTSFNIILQDMGCFKHALEYNWLENPAQFSANFPVPAVFLKRGHAVGSQRLMTVQFLSQCLRSGYGESLDTIFMNSGLLPVLLSLFLVSPTCSALHCELLTFFQYGLTRRSPALRKHLIVTNNLPSFILNILKTERERRAAANNTPSSTPSLHMDTNSGTLKPPRLQSSPAPHLSQTVPRISSAPEYLAHIIQLARTVDDLQVYSEVSDVVSNLAEWKELFADIVQVEIDNQDKIIGGEVHRGNAMTFGF